MTTAIDSNWLWSDHLNYKPPRPWSSMIQLPSHALKSLTTHTTCTHWTTLLHWPPQHVHSKPSIPFTCTYSLHSTHNSTPPPLPFHHNTHSKPSLPYHSVSLTQHACMHAPPSPPTRVNKFPLHSSTSTLSCKPPPPPTQVTTTTNPKTDNHRSHHQRWRQWRPPLTMMTATMDHQCHDTNLHLHLHQQHRRQGHTDSKCCCAATLTTRRQWLHIGDNDNNEEDNNNNDDEATQPATAAALPHWWQRQRRQQQ